MLENHWDYTMWLLMYFLGLWSCFYSKLKFTMWILKHLLMLKWILVVLRILEWFVWMPFAIGHTWLMCSLFGDFHQYQSLAIFACMGYLLIWSCLLDCGFMLCIAPWQPFVVINCCKFGQCISVVSLRFENFLYLCASSHGDVAL